MGTIVGLMLLYLAVSLLAIAFGWLLRIADDEENSD